MQLAWKCIILPTEKEIFHALNASAFLCNTAFLSFQSSHRITKQVLYSFCLSGKTLSHQHVLLLCAACSVQQPIDRITLNHCILLINSFIRCRRQEHHGAITKLSTNIWYIEPEIRVYGNDQYGLDSTVLILYLQKK